MDIIRTENLTIGYRKHGKETIVCSGLNASLKQGCLTALLGRNGAGKSTLMRTLAGFQPPLSGEVLYSGEPLKNIPPKELAKKIGVVLTDRPQMDNTTAKEVVELGRAPYSGFWGHLSEEDQEAVEKAFRLVGIESLWSREMNSLSDGERQKVMIAKALAQQTPVIFLDEPTAFLDYPSKVELMNLLANLALEENKTVFLSTHDLDIAVHTAHCFWILSKETGLRITNKIDDYQNLL